VVYDNIQNITCEHPLENWIVFTAGPMGAGKGSTIHWLAQEGLFPRESFVEVEPDVIRKMLPEVDGYNERDRMTMGYRTQKEVRAKANRIDNSIDKSLAVRLERD
jgi:adenylylsulfate kinase-like enzyme